jgi:hypothetical protein
MIVIHYDERTSRYRLLVDKKKRLGSHDRNGMSSTLTIPTQQFLYGPTYDDIPPRTRSEAKAVNHSMYQVELRATPTGMEVEVEGVRVEAYSPDTIAHILQETELQREAGVSTLMQVTLRHNGEKNEA